MEDANNLHLQIDLYLSSFFGCKMSLLWWKNCMVIHIYIYKSDDSPNWSLYWAVKFVQVQIKISIYGSIRSPDLDLQAEPALEGAPQ